MSKSTTAGVECLAAASSEVLDPETGSILSPRSSLVTRVVGSEPKVGSAPWARPQRTRYSLLRAETRFDLC